MTALNYKKIAGHCLVLMAIMFIGGCQLDRAKNDAPTKMPPAIVKHYTKGPVKFELSLDHRRINSAQFFNLVLKMEAPENYTFELPSGDDEGQFGDFSIAGGDKSKPALNGKVISQQQSYLLEPEKTGEFKLPPIKVSAWENDKDKAPVIELSSEEISLTVESLLAPGEKPKLADIEPPVAEPVNWLLWSGIGAGVVILLLVGWFLWRHRKPKKEMQPPAVPPYLLALQAIEILNNKNLPAKGMTKEFYAELSGILRQYIEGHLGLRATEQTTEEFLAGLGSLATPQSVGLGGFGAGVSLLPEHKRILRDFLTHSDLVKFAEYQPNVEDIDSAITLCRQFINDTGGASSKSTPKVMELPA